MSIQDVRPLLVVAVLAVVPSLHAAAQTNEPPDKLDQRVYQLYANAEYEEALALLATASEPSAQMYRALCLLGLGRQDEAAATVDLLVKSAPEFRVTDEEVPPRFVALLTETRRQLLPLVLRKLFSEAREEYQAKALDTAIPRFEKIVEISSHADVRDVEAVADLRVLAEGFIDLTRAASRPAPVVEVSPPAPPAPPAAPARRTSTPPVALRQDMPAWPADAPTLNAPAFGAIQVRISSAGSVLGARIIKSIHPSYDTRVLANARFWKYTPAMVDGQAVESESIVQVRVNPARQEAR